MNAHAPAFFSVESKRLQDQQAAEAAAKLAEPRKEPGQLAELAGPWGFADA